MSLSEWFENHGALASFVLSAVTILSTLFLAWLEHQRAERAETARTREPAEAALRIVDAVCFLLELAKTDEENPYAHYRSAKHQVNVFLEPLKQIANNPIPSAELTLLLHSVILALNDVLGMVVPLKDPQALRDACQNRLLTLRAYRPQLVNFAKRPKARSLLRSIRHKLATRVTRDTIHK